MVGFFKKNTYFVIFKKWCFCKKFLAQFSYKLCFHKTFKVVNTFTYEFSCNLFIKFNFNNALVICNHGPPTPGAGRGIAVEMSGVFTFELSPQCGGNTRDLCYIGKKAVQ